jgi:tetratricopeptide (TPR) repeat protein
LLNDLAGAAFHFKEVTRLDPRRAGAHINLGAVYNRLDKLDEAIVELRRGIKLDHTRAEGFYNLGIVYRRQAKSDLAIQSYREAVRLNPRMSDAHYNIGNLYFEKEQYGMALAHYKQALQTRPTWDKALNGLAQCQELLNPSAAQPGEGAAKAMENGANTTATQPETRPDPHSALKPEIHGLMLSSVHKSAIDAESVSRSFLKILETEVEPTVKELAACLLFPGTGVPEVEKCLRKLESAIANMRNAQQELNTSMQRVQRVGERLLRG